MPKNVLIIDSVPNNNKCLISLFNELSRKDYLFYLLSNNSSLFDQFKTSQWPAKKIYLGPNILNSKINFLLFLILSPLILFICLVYLIGYKYGKNITSIICLGCNEKIIFTLLAKIMKIRMIWLELPDANYKNLLPPIIWLYKINSNISSIVAFTDSTKMRLKKITAREEKIKTIHPGIKVNHFEHQDTIFHSLAHTNKSGFQKKFFTVGTIVDLSHQQKVEPLLQAIKHCLTVIPNIQLIVVGDGNEKKTLSWLAKKMEIDSLVWFVGGKNHAQKWLSNFDIFVVTCKDTSMADLDTCLYAMSSGLPVIGPKNKDFEDIIREGENGLLAEADNSEDLAMQIINLQQNKRQRLSFGKNSRELAEKNFSISLMAEKFEKLLL
ncbi:MAG: glycosyltransferase [Candidatus Falkowbacteria bacterium]